MPVLQPPPSTYIDVKCPACADPTCPPCGKICAYGDDEPGGNPPTAVKGYIFHDNPATLGLTDTPPGNAWPGNAPPAYNVGPYTWEFEEIGWVFCDGADASKANWFVYWLKGQDNNWTKYPATRVYGRQAAETECARAADEFGMQIDVV